jgi:hypothetical protein
LRNTILWSNTPDQIDNDSDSAPTVAYCAVHGGYPAGTNIIAADPKLGRLGNYGGYTRTIPLMVGSPAIDTANDAWAPSTDQRGIARPQGAHADIGAFEGLPQGPSILLQGNNHAITNGDAIPDQRDGTDFGVASPLSGAVEHVFMVRNQGNAELQLTGNPKVTIGGANAADFAVTSQPASTVAPDGSTTFTVQFRPTVAGRRCATLVIADTDSYQNPYEFAIAAICAKDVYVDQNCVGTIHDGSSWATAYLELAPVLASTFGGDTYVHVARGTYKPTIESDRSATFQLAKKVRVLGGYPTGGGARDPGANVTILSGDTGVPGIDSDNSYHVVSGRETDVTAVLDGFTVTGGKADGPNDYFGGGMINWGGSPTVKDVVLAGNSASYGGGMANMYDSNPAVSNVTFRGNSAAGGGGIYNYYSSPALTNVTFSGNSANWNGGAIDNDNGSSPTLTNITINGNTAPKGGGICNCDSSCSPSIRNTILWGNTPDQIFNDRDSAPTVSYCVVQGGYASGTGIITADPLLGPLGIHGGYTQSIPLLAGSSAIDAADPTCAPITDQRGYGRIGLPDVGSYEYGVHNK